MGREKGKLSSTAQHMPMVHNAMKKTWSPFGHKTCLSPPRSVQISRRRSVALDASRKSAEEHSQPVEEWLEGHVQHVSGPLQEVRIQHQRSNLIIAPRQLHHQRSNLVTAASAH